MCKSTVKKKKCHWSLSTPPENRKPEVFLMFSGGIERDQWHERE